MSCSGCDGLEILKRETLNLFYTFPTSYDFTGYTASLRIAEAEGSASLLTVTLTPTANNSVASVEANVIQFTVNTTDLELLPDGDPITDPWVGMFEADIASPAGVVTNLEIGPFVARKGV